MTSASLEPISHSRLSYSFCVTLAYLPGLQRRLTKMEAFGNTLGDAGRFQTLIHPVRAVIAFDCFARFRIPLWCAPGAGRNAAFAAYAQGFLYDDNAIFGPLLNGTRWTGRRTPRRFAMKTGHEDVCRAGQTIHQLGANGYDLA
jgi:hypothetical protein